MRIKPKPRIAPKPRRVEHRTAVGMARGGSQQGKNGGLLERLAQKEVNKAMRREIKGRDSRGVPVTGMDWAR